MKIDSTPVRASHVNTGTSVPEDELPWPEISGPVIRAPKLHVEVDERSEVTPYGGLDLMLAFLRRFKVAEKIDKYVHVFKVHLPYRESDHVLAQAMNLYVGGTCIEDMANLQNSEAVLRMTGACRLPDPTTGGDFLRRFGDLENPDQLPGLRAAIDEVQSEVWRALARRGGRKKKKRPWAVIDIDSHIKELYGFKKEGADFSYNGKWSYHPLLISMATTGECLAVENRPGNTKAPVGGPEILEEVLPRTQKHFENTLLRGDSAFDEREMREVCEKYGAYFAFVGREFSDRPGIADSVPETDWKPFKTRGARRRTEQQKSGGTKRRRKKLNQRRRRARERGYQNMRLVKQWVAEVPWTHSGSEKTYRLVIRRQLIEHSEGQQHLFDEYRYRYVVTNLPSSFSMVDVIDETYQRCDQENVIEQMGSGLAAWRMPVAEFEGNSAWLEISRLAWNIGKWIAQLALPSEVVRWEWKRFRQAFVHLAAQVIKRGRRIWVRISGSHRFAASLVAAHQKLQT